MDFNYFSILSEYSTDSIVQPPHSLKHKGGLWSHFCIRLHSPSSDPFLERWNYGASSTYGASVKRCCRGGCVCLQSHVYKYNRYNVGTLHATSKKQFQIKKYLHFYQLLSYNINIKRLRPRPCLYGRAEKSIKPSLYGFFDTPKLILRNRSNFGLKTINIQETKLGKNSHTNLPILFIHNSKIELTLFRFHC